MKPVLKIVLQMVLQTVLQLVVKIDMKTFMFLIINKINCNKNLKKFGGDKKTHYLCSVIQSHHYRSEMIKDTIIKPKNIKIT